MLNVLLGANIHHRSETSGLKSILCIRESMRWLPHEAEIRIKDKLLCVFIYFNFFK